MPATTAPALPPVDREADALIGDLFNQHPDARYRMTQLAFVQEHALVEAQNRLKRLEWELQQAQQAAQRAGQQSQPTGGGFFSGLFGGRSQSAASPQHQGAPWGQTAPPPGYSPSPGYQPPPSQYPSGYQPGVFQRGGSGFLGSALTTAAGVAGGVLAAGAIRDMFSGNQGFGGASGGGFGGSPWASPETPVPSSDPGYVDQGSWTAPDNSAATPDQGYADSGTWDQSGADQSGADQSGSGSIGLERSFD